MQASRERIRPLQNSLFALAEIAMRETCASGYAFFLKEAVGPETVKLVRQGWGGEVIEENTLDKSESSVAYSLGSECVLAFAFSDHTRVREIRPQLDQLAETIQAVWHAGRATEGYAQLVSRVAELETSLMDSKIADRALGFLAHRGQDRIDVIIRHVEGVLRETPTQRTLQEISRELAEEVEARRLVGQAKALLQSSQEMSEQEAHAHLRMVSRKSRRRLKDVAQDVINRHLVECPVHQ